MPDFRTYIEFIAYKALATKFFLLPRPLCLAMGKGLGILAFHLDRKHRAVALFNLAEAFGLEKSERERMFIARDSFAHFGRVIADILKISHYSRKKIQRLITAEGREHLVAALARRKGVLLFTAHFGNWEIGSAWASEIAIFRVIARALDNRLIEKDLVRLRAKLGAQMIYKFGAGKHILRALKRNEIVAILIDQNVLRSQAVFVDFFGKQAATTPSLADLHLKTGAPLVPAFCHPVKNNRYLLKIMPPLEFVQTGSLEEDELKITQFCTKIIEQEIRRHPAAWLWVHKRWNTRPADEAPVS
jgi:KDO2-lipid IV(A) lauroyltransferase